VRRSAPVERGLLPDVRDINVEQHRRRIHPRANPGFACLAKVQHTPIERHVTRIHFDKNIADAAGRSTEYIRSVEQRAKHLFGPKFRINRQSREFRDTSAPTSISVELSSI
jgi:hypothetical protein